jgi:hypothetical protein
MTEAPFNTLTDIDREHVHNELAASTIKHIAANEHLFTPLPYAPDDYPSQRLEVVQLAPTPASRTEIDDLATFAAPDIYNTMKAALSEQPELRERALDVLRQGENVFPVTNHVALADIAIWSAAWSDYLEGDDPDNWQDHNAMVISRGVTTIGVFDMAASEILQKGGHVFMSFPRTSTIASLDIPDGLVSANNARMRSGVHRWLEQRATSPTIRGRSLNMAWSGKTDVIDYADDHQPERITLGGVNKRTVDILSRGWVLPVTVWVDNEHQEVRLGELTRVETTRIAERVQRWQGDTLADILDISQDAVHIEGS